MIRIPLSVLFNFPQELHLSAFAKKRSAMDQIETYLRGKYLWIIGFSLRIINHSPFLWWDWGGYHSFWLFCRRDLCMHGSLFSRHTSTLRNTCSSVCHDFQFMTFRTWKLLLVAWHAWHTWHAWNEGACGFHNRYFIPGTVQCTLLWDSTTLHYHVTSYQVPVQWTVPANTDAGHTIWYNVMQDIPSDTMFTSMSQYPVSSITLHYHYNLIRYL